MNLEVLIVDEDNIVLFLHQAFAKTSGLSSNATLFSNGKDAFDYLKAQDAKNTAFLLLLDINMPGMDGWDLLDAMNTQQFSSPTFVIIVTSSINKIDEEKAKGYQQVIDYRIKPITLEALAEIKQLDELKGYF